MFVSYILYQQQLWFFNVYSAQQIYYICNFKTVHYKKKKQNEHKEKEQICKTNTISQQH